MFVGVDFPYFGSKATPSPEDFFFDLEGPFAGGVVLEFDVGLEGEQGGGG